MDSLSIRMQYGHAVAITPAPVPMASLIRISPRLSLPTPVFPHPAAAAAATEAPLPVVLHFDQLNAGYGCQYSAGRLVYAGMPAEIAWIMVSHFKINPDAGIDGTILNKFVQQFGVVNRRYVLEAVIIFLE